MIKYYKAALRRSRLARLVFVIWAPLALALAIFAFVGGLEEGSALLAIFLAALAVAGSLLLATLIVLVIKWIAMPT